MHITCPDAVKPNEGSRIEHVPLHFHLFYQGKEYQIKIENFREYDGNALPKRVGKVLEDESLMNFLKRNNPSIFENGKLCKDDEPLKKLLIQ